MVTQKRIRIAKLFGGLQKQLMEQLKSARQTVAHAPTQGAAVEGGWITLLAQHLPVRYQVRRGFVIDAQGRLSDQIDLVIFDRQYSPFLLDYQGACYVPAESVYAVIEVKPQLSKPTLTYAGKKVASVRRLLRTSAPIPHAGGLFEPRRPFDILGAVLAESSSWQEPFGAHFERTIKSVLPMERIQLGCVLSRGAFSLYYEASVIRIETVGTKSALVFFILKLLQSLQSLGTVPAIDVREYARSLPIREKAITITKPVRPI
jgi:hypothetical protein